MLASIAPTEATITRRYIGLLGDLVQDIHGRCLYMIITQCSPRGQEKGSTNGKANKLITLYQPLGLTSVLFDNCSAGLIIADLRGEVSESVRSNLQGRLI